MRQWFMKYDCPARSFMEALPLGNGRMGAMVYGGTDKDRVSLNLDTLWSSWGQIRKTLQEWFEDFEEGEVTHRHVSHLYSLYPANTINKEETVLREGSGTQK